ncbi:hypothetical protein [Halobaculum sp. MBLA0143]|uniref:hypothetical protein n=1 Tax=Halobaculum sp. MBLA0143 TaxID=3079933 RepID=UPI003524C3AC
MRVTHVRETSEMDAETGDAGAETDGRRRQTTSGRAAQRSTACDRAAQRPVARGRSVQRAVARGEAALTDVRRAAAFRCDGGLRDLRRLADGGGDPRVRARATATLRAFARLARATGWDDDDRTTQRLGSRRDYRES